MSRKRVGPPKISKVKTTKSGSTRTYTKSLSGKWSITGWSGKTPRRKK